MSLIGCGGEGGDTSPVQPDSGNNGPIDRHVTYSDQAESLQGSLDRSNNQIWARTAGNPPVTKSFDVLSNVHVSNVTFDVHMLVKHYGFMDFNVQCPSLPNVDIRFKTSGEYWELNSQTEQFELKGGVNKTVNTWAEVQAEVGQCTFVEHSKTMSYGQIATGYALTTSNLLIEPYSNSYADGNGDDYQIWGGITICSTGMVGKNNECLIDTDGDGVPDVDDAFPNDPNEWLDTDGDGIGNNEDTDDDNDGVPDTEDAFPLDPTRSESIPWTPIGPSQCAEGDVAVENKCLPNEGQYLFEQSAQALQGSLDRSNNQIWARTAGNPPVTKSFDVLSNVHVSNVTFDVHMLVKHYGFMDFNVQCPSLPNVDIRFKTSGKYWELNSQTEEFELKGGVNKTVNTWAEVQAEVGQCTFVEHSKTMSYGQIATGYALTTSNLLIEPYSNSYADGNGDDYQIWGGITIN
ncbi:hypothetical protein VSAK1_10433 [Vibrio mediterranei AK1]|nr:hypothetical protein VSAK1_10433 [Vibrio mediterranei AK1]